MFLQMNPTFVEHPTEKNIMKIVSLETMKKESNLFFSKDTKMKQTNHMWNKMLECLPFYIIRPHTRVDPPWIS